MENEQEQEPTEEMTESANADPYGEEQLRQKVQVATRVAQEAGEFKDTAFEVTYKHLLGTQAQLTNHVGNGNGSTTGPPMAPKAARKTSARRTPKVAPKNLDRIKAVMDADPEVVSEYAAKIDKLKPKHQVYAVLAFARDKFGLDVLTQPEIIEVVNEKFRLGVARGTIAGRLSDAPAAELGRSTGPDGEKLYKLMRPGEDILKKALAGSDEAVVVPAA